MKNNIAKTIIERVDIEHDLDALIEYFHSLQEKYGNEYQRIYFERDYYGNNCYVSLMGERLESDEEYQKRLKEEEYRMTQKLELERKQYEALRAKFDKN